MPSGFGSDILSLFLTCVGGHFSLEAFFSTKREAEAKAGQAACRRDNIRLA